MSRLVDAAEVKFFWSLPHLTFMYYYYGIYKRTITPRNVENVLYFDKAYLFIISHLSDISKCYKFLVKKV